MTQTMKSKDANIAAAEERSSVPPPSASRFTFKRTSAYLNATAAILMPRVL
jgi:hypothetical protein